MAWMLGGWRFLEINNAMWWCLDVRRGIRSFCNASRIQELSRWVMGGGLGTCNLLLDGEDLNSSRCAIGSVEGCRTGWLGSRG